MPSIVEDLQEPEAYPEEVSEVELIQTHISFVFITDKLVYKVKKPVNFGFLDFSTLEKRKYYCEQEIKLNSRLSPQYYLDVVPVVERDGRLKFWGEGELVDYAVKMKKLPMDRQMKYLLQKEELTDEMLDRVAQKIAAFHNEAETSLEIEKFGELSAIKYNTDENFEQTEKYIGKTISKEQFETLKSYTDKFYEENEELIHSRMRDKRIRDCHGDLHMEHVLITDDDVVIFDCIEFNDRFRYSDIAADIAFLAMDLDYYGRSDLSHKLIEYYSTHSGDDKVKDMITFYKVYRAYVRGKVISFKLDDPHISQEEKDEAAGNAQKYFDLAHSYIR
ncbi:MAG: phosphotransferase [Archaeoglobaceae archaeon]